MWNSLHGAQPETRKPVGGTLRRLQVIRGNIPNLLSRGVVVQHARQRRRVAAAKGLAFGVECGRHGGRVQRATK